MKYRGSLCYLLQLEITDPEFGLPDDTGDPDEQARQHMVELGEVVLNQLFRFPYRRIRVDVLERKADVECLSSAAKQPDAYAWQFAQDRPEEAVDVRLGHDH
jgi:hypothetical protein